MHYFLGGFKPPLATTKVFQEEEEGSKGPKDGKQNENPSKGAHPVTIPRAWEEPGGKEKGKRRSAKK